MSPTPERLTMYGKPAENPGLEWAWVDEQLRAADCYWTVTPGGGHPHPRPVWGVWLGDALHLSLGSPTLRAAAASGPITVHLGSVTDVVILEGVGAGPSADASVLEAYEAKYDWVYDLARYGPFTAVAASTVLAWRAAGWAGRDGFQQTGRWRFPRAAG